VAVLIVMVAGSGEGDSISGGVVAEVGVDGSGEVGRSSGGIY
jgi:hypothetical protein